MTAKHTPGPWEARDYPTADGDIWVDCNSWRNPKTRSLRGGTVATVLKNGVGPEGTLEANARLIAAAPDLLRALMQMNYVEHEDGYCICPLKNGSAPDSSHATICVDARAAIAKATGAA